MQFGSVEFILEEGLEQDDKLIKMAQTLFSSLAGTFVCNRDFGIRSDVIDLPVPLVEIKYAEEVHAKLEKFIPQLLADKVEFRTEEDSLVPVISLIMNEDYDELLSDSDIEEAELREEDEYERD